MRNIVSPDQFPNGTPPGKAHASARDHHGDISYGYVLYDSLSEALKDAGDLLLETNARSVVINYKEPDESFLTVYELKRVMKLPKKQPRNPGDMSWFNPFTWF
jgi:hypothetical protein